jgi:crotonobetainyl-CoA:carnitine CoA-transferase CaiB-like acyl-CoA transferase
MQEAIKSEQLQARKMVSSLINPLTNTTVNASGPGFPIKFCKTPADYDAPSPIPGEHTEDILESLTNLTKEELLELIKKGVVGNFYIPKN